MNEFAQRRAEAAARGEGLSRPTSSPSQHLGEPPRALAGTKAETTANYDRLTQQIADLEAGATLGDLTLLDRRLIADLEAQRDKLAGSLGIADPRPLLRGEEQPLQLPRGGVVHEEPRGGRPN